MNQFFIEAKQYKLIGINEFYNMPEYEETEKFLYFIAEVSYNQNINRYIM